MEIDIFLRLLAHSLLPLRFMVRYDFACIGAFLMSLVLGISEAGFDKHVWDIVPDIAATGGFVSYTFFF
jgi:hypothetical protein